MKYKEFIFEIYETAWKEDHCRLVRRSVLGIRHDAGVGGKPGRREQSGKENCADGRQRRFAAISMPCSAFTAHRSKRQWIDLLSRMRKRELDAPVIIVSTADDSVCMRHCFLYGAIDFLVMPLHDEDLHFINSFKIYIY